MVFGQCWSVQDGAQATMHRASRFDRSVQVQALRELEGCSAKGSNLQGLSLYRTETLYDTM